MWRILSIKNKKTGIGNTKLHFTVLYFYAKQNTDSFGQEGFFKMFKQAREIYLLL